MSKQFKEGSDFEAAAKVLLGESTEDTLNEALINSLSTDRTYISANNTIKKMLVFFDEDSNLANKIRKSDDIGIIETKKEFRKMSQDLERLVRKWIKIVNKVEGNDSGTMPDQFKKYL